MSGSMVGARFRVEGRPAAEKQWCFTGGQGRCSFPGSELLGELSGGVGMCPPLGVVGCLLHVISWSQNSSSSS